MSLALFDTHCHLADPSLLSDIENVVGRARSTGVNKILVIGTNAEDSVTAQSIAHRFDLRFAAGIHPSESGLGAASTIPVVRELLGDPFCVAVGEIGLDFHYLDAPPRTQQEDIFRQMLILAQESLKPIILHQRDSREEILEILDEFDLPSKGVFHCFSGDRSYAGQVLSRGFHVSFAGNVTYKNSNLAEVAATLPIDRLLIETDAPYLSPLPYRGRQNEPGYIVETARRLADIRGVTLEEISERTSANACRLFGWTVSGRTSIEAATPLL